MARKRYTAEEIISQLRTVEIETAKGIGIVDACRTLGITEQVPVRLSRWGTLLYPGAIHVVATVDTTPQHHSASWSALKRVVHWPRGL